MGDGVVKQYEGLEVGKKVRWGNADWNVVGRFTDGGGIAESEAWGDTRVVQQAWRRGNSFQSIRAKLNNPASLKTLKDALTKDPRVRVGVQTERAFYADQQKLMSTIINNVGVGARHHDGCRRVVCRAEHAVQRGRDARARDRDAARAWDSAVGPVVFSVLVEAMILGAVGGLIGGLLAFVTFNGMHSSTMNWASFSQMTFAFTVTPQLMITGIVYGLILTFIAGILPGHPGGTAAHHVGFARVVIRTAVPGRILGIGAALALAGGFASLALAQAPAGLGRRRRPHPVRVLHQRCARAEQRAHLAQAEGGRGRRGLGRR